MKKAIITFGVGYSFEDIRYFIHSCNMNTPDSDVYIFVGANIEELKQQSVMFPRIHFIKYHEPLLSKIITKALVRSRVSAKLFAKFLSSAENHRWINASITDPLVLPMVQFMVKRFFLIKQLLTKLPHQQIMLTDIRDVLVLADPFKNLEENSILSGEEPVSIEESEMNSRWLIKTYSKELYEKVKKLPVICAGVTIGSRKAIDQYIAEMIHETYRQLPHIINMLGADQAIHMKLFYFGLKGLKGSCESNGSGAIATLHFSTLNEFRFDYGAMENIRGKKLTVVHQYDRHDRLANYLKGFFSFEAPVNSSLLS